MSETIPFPVSSVPLAGEYDVFLCGCGLSAVAAAWNMAERGLKVGIAEYFGKPGGVPVTGLLGIVSGWRLEDEIAIDGVFLRELKMRAEKKGGYSSRNDWGGRFQPEILGLILLEMLREKKIDLMLYTQLVAARTEDGEIREVFTASKQGLEAWRAKLFVDATGDGDLAAMTGCPFEYGRVSDGKVQSSSLTFKIGGIDLSRIPENMPEATKIWNTEPHNVPTNHTVITYLPNTNGEAAVNMTHILDCNPMTHEGQLRIRYEGTLQAFEIVEFFRRRMPGFENAYVSETAEQLGVRETRRILGDYVLTAEDVIEGRDFEDEIARGCWGIDIHDPVTMHGVTPMPHFCLKRSYGIPYRCITPRGIKNLYIAGRPISASHEAFSSSRINGSCIAIGEAIGVAAPRAIASGDTRKVNVSALQNELELQGAIVHCKHVP